MSDQHSLAPWTINWNIAEGPQTHPVIPTLHYAEISSADKNDRSDPLRITGYMRKVDIYLLATAPELLAACKAILQNVEEFGFENISVEHELATGVTLARAAIAKAEGRS